jgi:hypothetical protein
MMTNFHKNSYSLIFFLFIFVLIFYRGPCFLTEGIFQSDEFEFYKNAKENGLLNGLFYVYPGAGYFKLWTNISTTTASFFSFNDAKLITTYFSLLSYIIIFLLIYNLNSELFINLRYKIFAIFIVLLSPPMTPEIWMGSAHTREYFGILSFILIFYNPQYQSTFNKIIVNIFIFVSGLSSVWAVVLTPVYFIKFIFIKSKKNLSSFFSSLAASIIQVLIIFNQYLFVNLDLDRSRAFQIEISKIFNFIYNVPIRSFFGSTIPKFLFLESNLYFQKGFDLVVYFLTLILILFTIFYIIKKKDFILNLIFLSFILISGFSLIGSLYPDFSGGRYAVVPGVILIFLVLRVYTIEKNLLLKFITGFLLFFSVLTGLIEFKYKSPLPHFLNCNYYESIN